MEKLRKCFKRDMESGRYSPILIQDLVRGDHFQLYEDDTDKPIMADLDMDHTVFIAVGSPYLNGDGIWTIEYGTTHE